MSWNPSQRVSPDEVEDLIEENDERRRRAFRRGLWGSLIGHVGLVVFFAVTPAPTARPLPAAVTVDLVAGVPKPAAAKRPAPARAAPPKPAPAKPVAAPKPPPPPKPTKRVLPKQPAPLKKQPRKVVKPTPRPPPEKLDYDDALAKLRDDLGEPDAPAPEAEPDALEPEAGSAGGAGTPVSPETLRWITSVKRHVRSTYVTPPEFLNRALETCMTVFLTVDGRVMGEPSVTRSSGDVFWDDNSVRAMVRASPLPAPPGDGEWVICYTTEERE